MMDSIPEPEETAGQEMGRCSYCLTLAYDGGAFSGWQLQGPGVPTIQGRMEGALGLLLREGRGVLEVAAAGRTDAGVHALQQVVQFHSNHEALDTAKLPHRLNSLLPHSVRALGAQATAPDFHVTVSALSKTYHYCIDTGACHNPLTHHMRLHVPRPLSLLTLRAGAEIFVGTHDFTQFSNLGPEGAGRRDPVKSLWRFDVVEEEGGLRLEVEGSGFLYKQVRHMVGALLVAAHGRLALGEVARRLELGSRQPPGRWIGYNIAPSKGLCLAEVRYPANAPGTLLYPELEHDEHGRLLCMLPGRVRAGGCEARQRQRQQLRRLGELAAAARAQAWPAQSHAPQRLQERQR